MVCNSAHPQRNNVVGGVLPCVSTNMRGNYYKMTTVVFDHKATVEGSLLIICFAVVRRQSREIRFRS